MNVRIFWVRAMKCVYAQTRPRFILSSEGVFWGNGVWTHVNSKGKIPSTKNVPKGGSNPRHCGQRAQALPTELFRPSRRSEEIVKISSCASQCNRYHHHYNLVWTSTRPPPRWPSGQCVRLESGRSGVRIQLATEFFPGRVIPMT